MSKRFCLGLLALGLALIVPPVAVLALDLAPPPYDPAKVDWTLGL